MAYHCGRCGRTLKGESGIDYVRSGWTWVEAHSVETTDKKGHTTTRQVPSHWAAKPGARYCMPRDQEVCDRRAAKRKAQAPARRAA